MISQTAEYALRAIVYLGNQTGVPCTTAALAKEIDAPTSYLAKVLKGLSRAGVIASQRGLHGGFTLSQDPNKISVLDVVNAVDSFHRIEQCPLGRKGHENQLCPLHRRIDRVMKSAEESLDEISIGEVLEEPGLLCSLPCLIQPVGLETQSKQKTSGSA